MSEQAIMNEMELLNSCENGTMCERARTGVNEQENERHTGHEIANMNEVE